MESSTIGIDRTTVKWRGALLWGILNTHVCFKKVLASSMLFDKNVSNNIVCFARLLFCWWQQFRWSTGFVKVAILMEDTTAIMDMAGIILGEDLDTMDMATMDMATDITLEISTGLVMEDLISEAKVNLNETL
jgi:hypothetical protein